jgi:D-threo-aldose 1-dehydrogenase
VLNAAVFGGGVLAKGTVAMTKYANGPAGEDLLTRIRQMEACCKRFGVPLKAAALQFSTKDPRVASTVVGVSIGRHGAAVDRKVSRRV